MEEQSEEGFASTAEILTAMKLVKPTRMTMRPHKFALLTDRALLQQVQQQLEGYRCNHQHHSSRHRHDYHVHHRFCFNGCLRGRKFGNSVALFMCLSLFDATRKHFIQRCGAAAALWFQSNFEVQSVLGLADRRTRGC